MKATYNVKARKRPVTLTLNEDLVVEVRGLTDNLSEVVELLLAGYVEHELRQRIVKGRALEANIAMWNDFNAKQGSFADEYSPL